MSAQKFIIPPQDNLSPTEVFDRGCYESRLKTLTEAVLEKLLEQDLKQFAIEKRKQFEDIPPYPYEETRLRFYEKAKAEAIKVIEQERKNVVEARKDYIRNTLNLIIRQAKLLVFGEKGKGKIYRKKVPIEGKFPAESHIFERDIFYFEDDSPAGRDRYEQICRLRDRLGEFSDYIPYLDADLLNLWHQAHELLDLEVVDFNAKTQKTE